jgi:hypothetical protein
MPPPTTAVPGARSKAKAAPATRAVTLAQLLPVPILLPIASVLLAAPASAAIEAQWLADAQRAAIGPAEPKKSKSTAPAAAAPSASGDSVSVQALGLELMQAFVWTAAAAPSQGLLRPVRLLPAAATASLVDALASGAGQRTGFDLRTPQFLSASAEAATAGTPTSAVSSAPAAVLLDRDLCAVFDALLARVGPQCAAYVPAAGAGDVPLPVAEPFASTLLNSLISAPSHLFAGSVLTAPAFDPSTAAASLSGRRATALGLMLHAASARAASLYEGAHDPSRKALGSFLARFTSAIFNEAETVGARLPSDAVAAFVASNVYRARESLRRADEALAAVDASAATSTKPGPTKPLDVPGMRQWSHYMNVAIHRLKLEAVVRKEPLAADAPAATSSSTVSENALVGDIHWILEAHRTIAVELATRGIHTLPLASGPKRPVPASGASQRRGSGAVADSALAPVGSLAVLECLTHWARDLSVCTMKAISAPSGPAATTVDASAVTVLAEQPPKKRTRTSLMVSAADSWTAAGATSTHPVAIPSEYVRNVAASAATIYSHASAISTLSSLFASYLGSMHDCAELLNRSPVSPVLSKKHLIMPEPLVVLHGGRKLSDVKRKRAYVIARWLEEHSMTPLIGSTAESKPLLGPGIQKRPFTTPAPVETTAVSVLGQRASPVPAVLASPFATQEQRLLAQLEQQEEARVRPFLAAVTHYINKVVQPNISPLVFVNRDIVEIACQSGSSRLLAAVVRELAGQSARIPSETLGYMATLGKQWKKAYWRFLREGTVGADPSFVQRAGGAFAADSDEEKHTGSMMDSRSPGKEDVVEPSEAFGSKLSDFLSDDESGNGVRHPLISFSSPQQWALLLSVMETLTLSPLAEASLVRDTLKKSSEVTSALGFSMFRANRFSFDPWKSIITSASAWDRPMFQYDSSAEKFADAIRAFSDSTNIRKFLRNNSETSAEATVDRDILISAFAAQGVPDNREPSDAVSWRQDIAAMLRKDGVDSTVTPLLHCYANHLRAMGSILFAYTPQQVDYQPSAVALAPSAAAVLATPLPGVPAKTAVAPSTKGQAFQLLKRSAYIFESLKALAALVPENKQSVSTLHNAALTLAEASCNAGHPEKTFAILSESLPRVDQPQRIDALRAAIFSLCSPAVLQPDRAMELFNQLPKRVVRAEETRYLAGDIISALAESGRTLEALSFLRKLQEDRCLTIVDDNAHAGILNVSFFREAAITAILFDDLRALRKAVQAGAVPAPTALRVYHNPRHRLHIRGVLQSLTPVGMPCVKWGMRHNNRHLLVHNEDLVAFLTAPDGGDDMGIEHGTAAPATSATKKGGKGGFAFEEEGTEARTVFGMKAGVSSTAAAASHVRDEDGPVGSTDKSRMRHAFRAFVSAAPASQPLDDIDSAVDTSADIGAGAPTDDISAEMEFRQWHSQWSLQKSRDLARERSYLRSRQLAKIGEEVAAARAAKRAAREAGKQAKQDEQGTNEYVSRASQDSLHRLATNFELEESDDEQHQRDFALSGVRPRMRAAVAEDLSALMLGSKSLKDISEDTRQLARSAGLVDERQLRTASGSALSPRRARLARRRGASGSDRLE